jgi:lysophospholipase L1-like esterase
MTQIPIDDKEIIVLYGDSITEQNLYAAYVETFLISRFPKKQIDTWNFGWGGDTAPGGTARFDRDVAPAKPTLVFSNFGMNDGSYVPPNKDVLDRYLAGQRTLAKAIKSIGARHVFVTTCPVDYDKMGHDDYNQSLNGLADGTIQLAEELELPSVDIFHPMRDVQKQVKKKTPGFTMIPDAVHPDAVGHLVMASYIMRQIEAPKSIGSIRVAKGNQVSSEGVKIENFRTVPEGIAFDLELPFIPFYVPAEARKALDFLPVHQEFNKLSLKVDGWNPNLTCSLMVDGCEAAVLSAGQLAKGVEIGSLDGASWSKQGLALWNLAQMRWRKHFDTWRVMGFEGNPAVKKLTTFETLRAAQKAHVEELMVAMRETAQPRKYKVVLAQTNMLVVDQIDFSPAYPYKENEFDKAFPPETDASGVKWKPARVENFAIDLIRHHGNVSNVVSYGRLLLNAEAACSAYLLLGSDDGLSVIVNGKRVLARDVRRGCVLDDQIEVGLNAGRNEILFRITQFGGAYGFALRGKVLGSTKVVVVKE